MNMKINCAEVDYAAVLKAFYRHAATLAAHLNPFYMLSTHTDYSYHRLKKKKKRVTSLAYRQQLICNTRKIQTSCMV